MLLWLSYLFSFYRTRKERVHSEYKKVDIAHVYWRMQYDTFEVLSLPLKTSNVSYWKQQQQKNKKQNNNNDNKTITDQRFLFTDQILLFLVSVLFFIWGLPLVT